MTVNRLHSAACVAGMSADLKRQEDKVDQLLASCDECATRTTRCPRCGRPVGATPEETEQAKRVILDRLDSLVSRYEMSSRLVPDDEN